MGEAIAFRIEAYLTLTIKICVKDSSSDDARNAQPVAFWHRYIYHDGVWSQIPRLLNSLHTVNGLSTYHEIILVSQERS